MKIVHRIWHVVLYDTRITVAVLTAITILAAIATSLFVARDNKRANDINHVLILARQATDARTFGDRLDLLLTNMERYGMPHDNNQARAQRLIRSIRNRALENPRTLAELQEELSLIDLQENQVIWESLASTLITITWIFLSLFWIAVGIKAGALHNP